MLPRTTHSQPAIERASRATGIVTRGWASVCLPGHLAAGNATILASGQGFSGEDLVHQAKNPEVHG